MQFNYGFLCDYAMISNEGKGSIIGIFKQVNVPSLPFQLPSFFVAFEIGVHPSEMNREFDLRVEFVDADGGKIWGVDGKINIQGKAPPGSRPAMLQHIHISGLTFTRTGGHEVNVLINGEVKGSIPFDVVRVSPPRTPNIPQG